MHRQRQDPTQPASLRRAFGRWCLQLLNVRHLSTCRFINQSLCHTSFSSKCPAWYGAVFFAGQWSWQRNDISIYGLHEVMTSYLEGPLDSVGPPLFHWPSHQSPCCKKHDRQWQSVDCYCHLPLVPWRGEAVRQRLYNAWYAAPVRELLEMKICLPTVSNDSVWSCCIRLERCFGV